MNTNEIRKDLQDALENIDKNNHVLASIINHLEEQCTNEEVQLIENQIFELPVTEYHSVEEFIEDYQPIFDLVDFPFEECFRVMNKRKLDWSKL